MRALRSWPGILGSLVLAGLPETAVAQAVGSEFQVNTYATGYQSTLSFPGHHLVAADASGNFVVVWHGRGQDGRLRSPSARPATATTPWRTTIRTPTATGRRSS